MNVIHDMKSNPFGFRFLLPILWLYISRCGICKPVLQDNLGEIVNRLHTFLYTLYSMCAFTIQTGIIRLLPCNYRGRPSCPINREDNAFTFHFRGQVEFNSTIHSLNCNSSEEPFEPTSLVLFVGRCIFS